MNDERLAWIRVGLARNLDLRPVWSLVRSWGSARAVTDASAATLAKQWGSPGRRAYRKLRAVDPGRVLDAAGQEGQRVVTPADGEYPAARLQPLADPPAVLFVRGGRLDDVPRAVALVGSRRATAFGLDMARTLANELAGAAVSVVSGFALGVDGAAHRGALEAGGHTVAVLGCGLDVPYPAAHVRLGAQVVEAGGALCTEHPPGQRPARWHFLRRNRLIAALADATVVVEAAQRSGALATARLALEVNREVLAVPGPARSPQSAGCHKLLREGAGLCETADDVFGSLGWAQQGSQRATFEPTGPTACVWHQLDVHEARDVDALCRQTGLDAAAVSLALTEWELAGHVQRVAGVGFRRRV